MSAYIVFYEFVQMVISKLVGIILVHPLIPTGVTKRVWLPGDRPVMTRGLIPVLDENIK